MPFSTYLAESVGSVTLSPTGPFEAGSSVSLTLTYTAGKLGVDDTGGIKISFRTTSDMGKPQFKDPKGPGYTTAEASNGAGLECLFDRINIRPWTQTIYVRAMKGFLRPSDQIIVRIGDRRFGGPGIRMQTNAERDFPLKVFADVVAAYEFVEVPNSPVITLLPGPCTGWAARLPTLRRPGEKFHLGLMPLDRWGNATDLFESKLLLRPSIPVTGLPAEVSIRGGAFGAVIDDLSVNETGTLMIDVLDAACVTLCRSNPLSIAPAEMATYWADLHAQSGETVGAGTARDYFFFARDKAHLDIVGHQGNDFQITNAFWQELNNLYREFNAPGRFVTIPGYEWSGNTGVGGDRNVFFPEEGRTIHRSSHTLVEDGRGDGSACLHVSELFDRLRGSGALLVAHVGGRYADIAVGHDGCLEPAVEVHSSWGTFEWILHDALALGHRVGVVCGSDDHKGRPGATNPGDSLFGAIGGLTCFFLPELSRSAVFDALRKRRHYGTTGNRLHLEIAAEFPSHVRIHETDPALAPSEHRLARSALMGDIVEGASEGTLRVDILGSASIERVTVFDGATAIGCYRPFQADRHGRRIRILWEGAEYRGRGRMVVWDGKLEVAGNRILKAAAINFLNPDKPLRIDGERTVHWQSVTTGNFAGVDLWLADKTSGEIRIDTRAISGTFQICDLGLDDNILEAGGLGKRLRAFRLPDENNATQLSFSHPFLAAPSGDTALYVRVTQEDGHQAWSSPIYLIPKLQQLT